MNCTHYSWSNNISVTRTYTPRHTRVHVYTVTHAHTHTHTHTLFFLLHTHAHTHTHTYIPHTHTHTHAYTHTHTHTNIRTNFRTVNTKILFISSWLFIRVGLTRISSQLPVSDLGEWRHICHYFRWQKMWRVTFLGRMWPSRTRKYFC